MTSCNTCTQCESVGPTLLPVRYAVRADTPDDKLVLPEWANNNISLFPKMNGFKYILRLLSEGYLYVYYTARKGSWECWKINDKGELYKQPSASAPQNGSDECNSVQHRSTNVEFITLNKTAFKNDVWIAFVRHAWSPTTLDKYTKSKSLREERMQKIEPHVWRSGQGPGIISATEQTIKDIPEYQSYVKDPIEYPPRISETYSEAPYFKLNHSAFQPKGTIEPWIERWNLHAITRAYMDRRQNPTNYETFPLIMALHDPIGISHELTGWSDELSGINKQFSEELSVEYTTDSYLEAAKEILKNQVIEEMYRESNPWYSDLNLDDGSANEPSPEHEPKNKNVAFHERHQKMGFYKTRDEFDFNNRFEDKWKKYSKKLNHNKLDSFRKLCDTFNLTVNDRMEKLAEFRVQWISNDLYIDHLQDYHSTDEIDNIIYTFMVSYSIASLDLTNVGSELLDGWILEYSTESKRNLVWRLLTLNNPVVMNELEEILIKVKEKEKEKKEKDKSITSEEYVNFAYTLQNKTSKLVKAWKVLNDYVDKGKITKTTKITTKSGAIIEKTNHLGTLAIRSNDWLNTFASRFFSPNMTNNNPSRFSMVINRTLIGLTAGIHFNTLNKYTKSGLVERISKAITDEEKKQARALHFVLEEIKANGNGKVDLLAPGYITKDMHKGIGGIHLEHFNDFNSKEGIIEYASDHAKLRISKIYLIFNMMEVGFLISIIKQDKDTPKKEKDALVAKLIAGTLGLIATISSIVSLYFSKMIKIDKLGKAFKSMGGGFSVLASLTALYLYAAELDDELNNKARMNYIAVFFAKIVLGIGVVGQGMYDLLAETTFKKTISSFLNNQVAKGFVQRFLINTILRRGVLSFCGFAFSPYGVLFLLALEFIPGLFFDDELEEWCEKLVFGKKARFEVRSTISLSESEREKVIKDLKIEFEKAFHIKGEDKDEDKLEIVDANAKVVLV
ncbi:T6SS effector BTH_I2691 family protein [Xenorhabdus szentirmaii]|uniref:T6SS effector BTH_I2691 family protein n=1 Tax=Xenorhabdus szentirmaii TaxID=290112 RepID=UPI0019A6DF2E|nr:T6SS effector BTH_I2691 family protein [Xenorhabdus sp. 5]MBD2826997.1 hypothetical protein [Xenorhabdus sp. 5]